MNKSTFATLTNQNKNMLRQLPGMATSAGVQTTITGTFDYITNMIGTGVKEYMAPSTTTTTSPTTFQQPSNTLPCDATTTTVQPIPIPIPIIRQQSIPTSTQQVNPITGR
jgi:hypothetical protein